MSVYSGSVQVRDIKYSEKITQGKVLKVTERSDTHVSGGGSSVVIKGYGGGGSKVTSRVVVTTEIWIETEHGKETPFKLIDSDISVREGQYIRVIEMTGDDFVNGYILHTVVNMSNPDLTKVIHSGRVTKPPKNPNMLFRFLNPLLVIAGLFFFLIPGLVYGYILYKMEDARHKEWDKPVTDAMFDLTKKLSLDADPEYDQWLKSNT